MPSLQNTMSSDSLINVNEHRWIINIRKTLEEELEAESEIPVSIFNVPKTLMAIDPVSYVPQQVALGPYHHWRAELYEMERYKLAAAKRTLKNLQGAKFQQIVDKLMDLETKIRASYHKYLDFNNETLSWMMAIDASFLLEFLSVYAVKEGVTLKSVSSRMSHLVDFAGRKSAHNAILRDIVMLENQIPIFVLRKLLELQFHSVEMADELLVSMLMGLFKELSPFKTVQDAKNINLLESAHLLDFLYDLTVPKPNQPTDEATEFDDHDEITESSPGKNKTSSGNSSYVTDLFKQMWNIVSQLNKAPVRLLKALIFSKPVKVILKLPWTIVSNLPVLSVLKTPVEYFFFSSHDKDDIQPENGSSGSEANKPPLVEEITIPSVSDLVKSGVRISPSDGNITSITFDSKTKTLCLPTISLDVNTEVVLRNLVAYEASHASGPLILTRYTELMNGIIDTEEDVKLLRQNGIVSNRLKSDEEAAKMWNGMSKSIRLTKVEYMDKVIEDVNKYYNGRWKVKVGKFMKDYVFGSWQFLTFLAAICLLLLMSLQAFCSVYSCARLLRIGTISSST